MKNPVLLHGASSKEKALLAIHPRSSERGILAFSREPYKKETFLSMKGIHMKQILGKIYVNIPFSMLSQSYLSRFISMRMNPEIGIDAAALDQYPVREYHRVAKELDRWVQVLGPYLRQLHLHDNRGEEDEHLALGQGSIDFKSLFGLLRAAIKKPLVLTLEPHQEKDLWPSIGYLEINWHWEA